MTTSMPSLGALRVAAVTGLAPTRAHVAHPARPQRERAPRSPAVRTVLPGLLARVRSAAPARTQRRRTALAYRSSSRPSVS